MIDLNQNFQSLKENRWNVSQTQANVRIEKLKKLKETILVHREEIKAALFKDFKKPYPESELTEIHTVLDEINFATKRIKKWMKPKKVPTPLVLFGSRSAIHYEAKGVVLILAPWNYPFSLLINPLVAAVAAGNCIVVKPSEKTPATAFILRKILSEVFPSNEVFFVEGDAKVAADLLKLPFDHIFFTGSPQVGQRVMEAASRHLTSVTLELGGKSPVVIDRNVDLKMAASRITWGKFINGGQTCVAPDYVFVPEESHEQFCQEVAKCIQQSYGLTVEERKMTNDFARIIDDRAFDRINNALSNEKKLLPDQADRDNLYLPPTVLVDVKTDAPIMKEEIFGPILPIIKYKNIETVIEYIQTNPKPLALYVFSFSRSFVAHLKSATTSGGMAINQVVLHLANPYLPFGGVGTSGMGSYHGYFGFKVFSHEKSILTQSWFTLTNFYFPPYSGSLKKMAFKLLRLFE